MITRYCPLCDAWVKGRECPKCGADTMLNTHRLTRHQTAAVMEHVDRWTEHLETCGATGQAAEDMLAELKELIGGVP